MSKSGTKDSPLSEFKDATGHLVFINIGFYLLSYILGLWAFALGLEKSISLYEMPSFSVFFFAFSTQTFFAGFLWTPFTSMFLHADLAHLFGNILFLLIYGFFMEDKGFKNKDIYKSYLISGLTATVMSAPILGNSFQLGASGAIFGLLGTILGWARNRKLDERNRMFGAGIIFFIFSSTTPGTNIFAHLIGFLTGLVLGAYGIVGKDLKVIE